ncbi:MAG: ATP-binding protein, partial [Saprospiraceae bacterium]|nr:ATP-binding protein [Saprospiraceae bacterium]
MGILPINLDDLIHAKAVESVRREFKKGWSEPTQAQVIHSICAFANDLQNLNGGYIILGIEEYGNGLPLLPPTGLEGYDLDKIQQRLRVLCKSIDPEYQAIFSPEIYQGKQILVIWVPGGDLRPYQAPNARKKGEKDYFVRIG